MNEITLPPMGCAPSSGVPKQRKKRDRAAYWQEYRSRPGVRERLRASDRAARAANPEKYRERDRKRLRKHYAQITARQLSRRFCFGDLRHERLLELKKLEADSGDFSLWERFAASFPVAYRDPFFDDRFGDEAARWLAKNDPRAMDGAPLRYRDVSAAPLLPAH